MIRLSWFWDGMGPNLVSAILLSLVNIINYIDRYTPSSLISNLKSSFEFTEQWKAGFLQTSQFLALTIIPPVYGVLGDRVSRKVLIIVSFVFWTSSVLMSSFAKSYWAFLALQTLVGFGEAGFTTVTPTVFPDLFRGRALSIWLAAFYFAIPVGNGLGYILARSIQSALSDSLGKDESWRWAIRFTFFPAIVLAMLLVVFLKDPPRGITKQDQINVTGKRKKMKSIARNFFSDVQAIFAIKTYTLSLLGMVCMYFMTGALAWWGPTYLKDGCNYLNWTAPAESFERSICGSCNGTSEEYYGNIDFYFGAIMLVAGIIGITIGTFLSAHFRRKYPAIDPFIIGIGLLLASIFLFVGFLTASSSILTSLVLIFFGTTFACLNWAVVVDMTLYVVPPPLRSTATGLQTAIAHGFGDAGSPYIVGLIADALKERSDTNIPGHINSTMSCSTNQDDAMSEFSSMQGALWITIAMACLSGMIFMLIAKFVVADKKRAEGQPNEEDSQTGTTSRIEDSKL